MDIRWEERQRAFQARVLTTSDESIDLRPYRTFVGASTGRPQPATSRIERAWIVVVGGTVVAGVLALIGAPREATALAAGLAGGLALIAGLAGPEPSGNEPSFEPLLAIYRSTVGIGETPQCITRINQQEMARLGANGYGTLVGSSRPGATLGLFVDDYLVWARTPPRGAQAGDPAFGVD